MSMLTERPQGADVTDPDAWKPSDPSRWAHLNLVDPDPAGALPKDALVADALAWALVPPGATDPVEGIVDGVRVELVVLADLLGAQHGAGVLLLLARRLEAAMLLLRWTDGREKMLFEVPEPVEEPPSAAPPPPVERSESGETAPTSGTGNG